MLKKALQKYDSLSIYVKASVWYFICSFLQKGIAVLTTPIFTRLMSTAEYGQISVFSSWLRIVAIFTTLRLYYGVYSQGLVKFDKEQAVYSSSLQGLVLTMVSVWFLLYLLFRHFVNALFSLSTVQMVAMFVSIWTEAVFCFWAAEQRINIQYKKLVILTICVTVLKPVIGIIFVLNAQDKVTARIVGTALVELLAYFSLFVVQMKRGKVFYSSKFWKYAICFNIPLIPHYLSQSVLNSADRIMIERMIGADKAGIYSLAYSISMLLLLLNTALSQTMGPWILKKIKNGRIEDTTFLTYLTLVFVAAANLFLIALAPECVALFAPASYQEAIWVIPPIAMSVYFIFAYDLFSCIEFYYEKTKSIMVASLIASLANVVLNYFFIKAFGYIAAGYTTLICYAIYAAAHYIFMARICRKNMGRPSPYDYKILLLITAGFVLAGFLFLATYRLWILRYLMIGVFVVYLIVNRKKVMQFIVSIRDMRLKKDRVIVADHRTRERDCL